MFQWFHNLKIKHKLIGSFLFITLLTIILSVFTWVGQVKAKNALDELLNVNSRLVELSYETQNEILLARQAEKNYLLNYRQLGFTQAEETYLSDIAQRVANVHQNMEDMRAISPNDNALVTATQQIDQAIDEYQNTFSLVVNGLERQGYANAGLEGEFSRKIKQVQSVVRSLQNDKLLIDVLLMQLEEKDYIHLRDDQYVTALDNANKKFIADVNKTEMFDSDKKGLETLVTQYADLFSQVLAIDADVSAQTEQYQAAVAKLTPLLENIRAHIFANQTKTVTAVQNASRAAQTVTLFLSIAVVVLGVSIGLFLSQTISSAVEGVAQAATGLAKGNLDQNVTIKGNDELGLMAQAFSRMIDYFREMATVAEQLARGDLTATVTPLSEADVLGTAFANMTHTLRELVEHVTRSASAVSESAEQLTAVAETAGQAAGNVANTVTEVARRTAEQSEQIEQANLTVQQVSHAVTGVAQGAQEQASAVGQSMTQVENISSAVETVADNAQAGTKQVGQTAAIAQDGVSVVEKTIAGMTVIKEKVGMSAQRVEEMGERSQRIEAIIETIDDIAAQTNLLALNAAIEAARAGEHGKGFAVVADEVRKLAEKSATATQEIGGLIKDIQKTVKEAVEAMAVSTVEVNNGVTLAGQSGEALHKIMQSVASVEAQVTAIAAASQDMNAASQSMVQSMESVSAVVEENTASTEEMAAGIAEVTDVINAIAEISSATTAAVQDVSDGAMDMHNQVEQARVAAHHLNQLSDELMTAVATFKINADMDANIPIEQDSELPVNEIWEEEMEPMA